MHDDASVLAPVDLDVTDDNNTILDEGVEDNTGSTATVNNDDDNVSNPSGSGSDMAEAGQVIGENDLRRLVIQPAAPGVASVAITWTADASKLKIYENADRTSAIASGKTYTAAAISGTKNLFLEARSVFLDEKVTCTEIGGTSSDFVKVSSLQFTDLQYVPDHSKFVYSVSPPVGGTVDVTVQPAGAATVVPAGGNFYDIFWQAGPTAAKLVATPPGGKLPTSKDVDVIAVDVSAPSFTPTTPAAAGFRAGGGGVFLVAVTGSLAWGGTVTLTGPDAPVHRGLPKFRCGFIQNIAFTVHGGRYSPAQLALLASTSGQTYLDRLPTSFDPWYDAAGAGVFFGASSGFRSLPLTTSDGPTTGAPLTYDQNTSGTPDDGDEVVDFVDSVWNFDLSLCAQTMEAPSVFTKQASAPWVFNGNGGAQQVAPYDWTHTRDAQVIAPVMWTEVTDGSVPITSGTLANTALGSVTFAP